MGTDGSHTSVKSLSVIRVIRGLSGNGTGIEGFLNLSLNLSADGLLFCLSSNAKEGEIDLNLTHVLNTYLI